MIQRGSTALDRGDCPIVHEIDKRRRMRYNARAHPSPVHEGEEKTGFLVLVMKRKRKRLYVRPW